MIATNFEQASVRQSIDTRMKSPEALGWIEFCSTSEHRHDMAGVEILAKYAGLIALSIKQNDAFAEAVFEQRSSTGWIVLRPPVALQKVFD